MTGPTITDCSSSFDYFNPHLLMPSRYGYCGFGVFVDFKVRRRGVSLEEIWADPDLQKLFADKEVRKGNKQ